MHSKYFLTRTAFCDRQLTFITFDIFIHIAENIRLSYAVVFSFLFLAFLVSICFLSLCSIFLSPFPLLWGG